MPAEQIEMPITAAMEKKPDNFMLLLDKIQHMTPEAQGKVLDNYERFLAIQAKQAFDEAMAALKRNMPPIIKSKLADMNGKYSYRYADLHKDVCAKLDPVLEAHGFGYRWTTHPNEQGVTLGCILYHVHGHHEETLMPPAPHDNSGGKNSIQAIGSTLSYLQRYSLLMALGIAPKNVDTDGNVPKGTTRNVGQEKEYQERCKYFDKCLNAEELKEHWMKSRAWAREIKDETAVNDFDYLKEKRKKELSEKKPEKGSAGIQIIFFLLAWIVVFILGLMLIRHNLWPISVALLIVMIACTKKWGPK